MKHRSLQPLLALALALACLGTHAQTVYRSVGADGRVTYSDRSNDERAQAVRLGGGRFAPNTNALPYELGQVAQRYPVTLYTTSNCAPCERLRDFLIARGIPFAERTVNSLEDQQALTRVSGSKQLPFGTIGAQHLVGFSAPEWSQYLDVAGYPRQSQLPSGYARPAAAPLAGGGSSEQPSAPTPAAPPSTATPPRPVSPAQTSTANPAGIRF